MNTLTAVRDSSAYRLSEFLLNDQSLDAALQQATREISRSTGFPTVAVQLYDPARQMVVQKGSWSVPETGGQTIETAAESLSYGAVLRDGNPLVETGGMNGVTLQTRCCG